MTGSFRARFEALTLATTRRSIVVNMFRWDWSRYKDWGGSVGWCGRPYGRPISRYCGENYILKAILLRILSTPETARPGLWTRITCDTPTLSLSGWLSGYSVGLRIQRARVRSPLGACHFFFFRFSEQNLNQNNDSASGRHFVKHCGYRLPSLTKGQILVLFDEGTVMWSTRQHICPSIRASTMNGFNMISPIEKCRRRPYVC